MRTAQSPRTVVPSGFFPTLLLPFAAPILLTLLLAVAVGEQVPRTIAPGSGLKLAGLGCSALAGAVVWRWATSGIEDRRARLIGALVCSVTALLGWPVWTLGILPSVNGLSLQEAQTVRMILERTEVTSLSRSRDLNRWAWLKAENSASAAGSGRYSIPEEVYYDWSPMQRGVVTVTVARGLLGAVVVTGYH